MTTSPSERYVWLRGGLVVPLDPLMLVLDLEARGFRMTPDAAGDLVVSPASRLTADDYALLRRWKAHVVAVLSYQPPDPVH